MSENLDLVRSIYAAIGRGDYGSSEWADPKIEYVVADGPEPGNLTGRDGLVQAMRNLFSAFEDVRAEAEEYRELDAERVLVLTRVSGRGKTSGVQIGDRAAELFEFHDGKVTRIVAYFDRENALADLGLAELAMSEEAVSPDLAARWQEAADAYARRDLHTAMHRFAPDAVWDFSSAGFGSFGGAAAIRSFLEDWLGAYEEYEYKQEEALDLGNGVLFVVASLGGRPTGSAGGVQERCSYTVTWAAGMVVGVVLSQDIETARAAAERLAEERG